MPPRIRSRSAAIANRPEPDRTRLNWDYAEVAGPEEHARIVDAICARGGETMMHRNWGIPRCLEAATGPRKLECRRIVACMRAQRPHRRLATNCYEHHVLQKALDCKEEVFLLIVSELNQGDPVTTLVNKHASHVGSKITELSWTPPAPPIFAVNKSLKGNAASRTRGERQARDRPRAPGTDAAVFSEVAKSQWGSYCIQHIPEHGSEKHRQMAFEHFLTDLLEFVMNEQGSNSVVKALKEGGKETEPRRAAHVGAGEEISALFGTCTSSPLCVPTSGNRYSDIYPSQAIAARRLPAVPIMIITEPDAYIVDLTSSCLASGFQILHASLRVVDARLFLAMSTAFVSI
ncbi:hypothetical protein C8R44DRAFT_872273 [Mycena epipterygia]|nr:hypothetical protein C8R44DRAFT_872273 [Mycena epipterygia]